jgi:hypothetical protein
MAFLTDKRGNISVFRLSILALGIGIALLIIGVVSFQLDQNSRRQPFFPPLPPNAQQWGNPTSLSNISQRVWYLVPEGNIDEVAQFYSTELARSTGVDAAQATSLERCNRYPPAGEFTSLPDGQRPANDGKIFDPEFIEGQSLPFSFTCVFDRSGLGSNQSTTVTIYNGLPATDSAQDTSGNVVIVYEQRWQQ